MSKEIFADILKIAETVTTQDELLHKYHTIFETRIYEHLKSNEVLSGNTPWEITVDVINQSNREIDEVVQLYVGDEFASMIPAGEQLKRFQKVKIPAGQTVEVRFVLNKEDLMFVNEAGEWIFEPGKFNFRIGTKTGFVFIR